MKLLKVLKKLINRVCKTEVEYTCARCGKRLKVHEVYEYRGKLYCKACYDIERRTLHLSLD